MRQVGFDLVVAKPSAHDIAKLNGMLRRSKEEINKGNKKNLRPYFSGRLFDLSIGELPPWKNPSSRVFVAKNKTTGEIVGFASYRLLNFGDVKHAFVDHLAVKKELQRRGIGSKIFGVINADLLKNKISYAKLLTTPVSEAHFYPKTNWRVAPDSDISVLNDFEWFPKKKAARPILKQKPKRL